MPKLYNKHQAGYPSSAVYIGRGSPYGNSWSHLPGSKAENLVGSRDESVEMYELWLPSQPSLVARVKAELKGRDLLCFCAPKRCHGEVLLKVANDSSHYYRNWFSNMSRFDSPLIYQGIAYGTVENFYQAMKVKQREDRERIAGMAPLESKNRSKEFLIREDWDAIRLDVMRNALTYKFAPGTSWGRKLRMTTWDLVEWNNWGDKFWGVSLSDNKGENHLGKLLMEIRDKNS